MVQKINQEVEMADENFSPTKEDENIGMFVD